METENSKETQNNIDDVTKKQEKQKKATEQLSKAHRDLAKSQKENNKELKANSKTIKEAEKSYLSFGESIKSTAGQLDGLFKVTNVIGQAALAVMAINMLKVNSELYRTVINAGKGREAFDSYNKAAINLSKTMGATHEEANNVVKTLAKFQYAGTSKEINAAAEASYGLARAFGLNYEEVARNTVELQKWGQVSSKSTAAMYADIMKVSQANGLTSEGVSEVIKTTQNWSGVLKAFGKTAPMDVQRYNMSLAKTVSALEKVGVSASTSTRLLQELTDPEQIEENIPKYAALGISITDAISGNINPEKMGEGLKAFGEKLKQMGPIAGAQYAKAMGVSYKEAIKAASADLSDASKVDMTPEEKSAEAVKQLSEATKDVTEKIQDSIQKLGGFLRSLGPIVLLAISMIFPIINKRMTKTKEESLKNIEEIAEEEKKTKMESLNDELENLQKLKNIGIFNKSAIAREGQIREAMAIEEEKLNQEKLKEFQNSLMAKGVSKRKDLSQAYYNFVYKEEIELANNKLEQLKDSKQRQKELYAQMAELEEKIANTKTGKEKNILQNQLANARKLYEDEKKNVEKLKLEKQKIDKDLNSKRIELNQKETNKFISNYSKQANSAFVKLGQFLGNSKLFKKGLKVRLQTTGVAKTAKAIGDKIASPFKKVGGFVADKISKIKIGIAQTKTGEGKTPKKEKGDKKGGIGKALGSLGKSLGILSIVGMIIGKILQKIGNPFEDLINNLVDIFIPLFKTLMPIFSKILNSLIKNLLPPLLKLMAGLLSILNFIMKPINAILKGLSKIPGLGFLKDVAEGIEEATGKNTQNALKEAANTIADSNTDLTKKTEENTEATKQNKKEQVTAGKNGSVMVTKAQYSTSDDKQEQKKPDEQQENPTNISSETANISNVNSQNEESRNIKSELVEIKRMFANFIEKITERENGKGSELQLISSAIKNALENNTIPVSIESVSNTLATSKPDSTSFLAKRS